MWRLEFGRLGKDQRIYLSLSIAFIIFFYEKIIIPIRIYNLMKWKILNYLFIFINIKKI